MSADETLGEILHRARVAGGEQRPRPWPPEKWADRDPQLQRLDEDMAGAVAAAERSRLAAVLETLAERAREALSGYPSSSPAALVLESKAAAYEHAASVVRSGGADGEGGEP